MRRSNPLFLLAALAGCASSSDPPASTWDERQERVEQREEQIAQHERSERLDADAQREGTRDPNTLAVHDSSLTASKQESVTPASPSVDKTQGADSGRAASARNEKPDARADVTPLDQGNSERDLEITQQIRKSVMDDSTLSFTAKNVKIITKDGHVMLRGAVPTAAERTNIETAARSVAGATNVDSQLQVNP